jgi:hypothetical protein
MIALLRRLRTEEKGQDIAATGIQPFPVRLSPLRKAGLVLTFPQ